MRYKMHGIGAGSAHANIAFGICSYARRVTIFRTLRLRASSVRIVSCNRTDSVGEKSSQ